jgi:hypothetical protein
MPANQRIEQPVEGFIGCLNAHDWDGLAAFLAPRFVRVGGQADVMVYTPDEYVAWVKEILRDVAVYGKTVRRIAYSPDRRTAYADLVEFGGRQDGSRNESAAVYVFSLDGAGRIERMALYQMPSVPAA